MAEREAELIRKLAELKGIQPSYLDMQGKIHDVSFESLSAILAITGAHVSNSREVRVSLKEELSARSGRFVEPVFVAWNGELKNMVARFDPEWQRGIKLSLRLENGEIGTADAAELDESVGHCLFRKGRLPFGYHRLEIETKNGIFSTLVIAAPRRSFSHSGAELIGQGEQENGRETRGLRHGKLAKGTCKGLFGLPCGKWGAFMPLYALQSSRSWGAGNIGDLQRLADCVAENGGGVLSTLPLMTGFLHGAARDPSPYAPVSRLFWNEFYVDIERASDFAECAPAQKKLQSAAFRQRLNEATRSRCVDYEKQMRLRREVLQIMANSSGDPKRDNGKRLGDFQTFLRERPMAREYARFRAVYDQLSVPWLQWPAGLRGGNIRAGDFAPQDEQYHLYAQWLAQRQIEELVEHCRDKGIRLYLDLPVGVSRSGFDVWRNQQLFACEASAGAPPDMFFSKGQNWGFPPMLPEPLRKSGYQHVIDYLRFQMRHASMLRIDHVMGLHRLYWIPPGFSAEQGAYVRYPAEELHAIVCLESHRNRCEIIGENLGTVPEEVNRAMENHGHGKMYVVQFEHRPSEQALAEPARQVVASLNTHDTPTFAAHWRGLDIPFRARLGLLKKGQVNKEQLKRKELNLWTARFLKRKGFLKTDRAGAARMVKALLRWLGTTKAETVLIALEDLWGETRPQNVPGTLAEYPNWRRKAAKTLEQIERTFRNAQSRASDSSAAFAPHQGSKRLRLKNHFNSSKGKTLRRGEPSPFMREQKSV